jgi:hypothetical protein
MHEHFYFISIFQDYSHFILKQGVFLVISIHLPFGYVICEISVVVDIV